MLEDDLGVSQRTAPKRRISRRRQLAFIMFAIAMGLLLAFMIAETVLRIHVAQRGWTPNCYVTGLAFFVPHAATGQTLRPGLRLKSSSYDVRVNDLGFRGPEIETVARERILRIAVIGGSSVFGYLVPEGSDSCRLLESDLRRLGHEVEVINAGVPGFNMEQCLTRYQTQVAPLQPDIVLLYLGWNDSPSLIGQSVAKPSEITAPSITQRILIHSVLYGFLRFRVFPSSAPQFAPPVGAATKPVPTGVEQFDRNLDRLIEAVNASAATPIVCTQLMAAHEDCEGLDEFMGTTVDQIQANQTLGRTITDRVRSAAHRNHLQLIEINECVECNHETLGDAIHLTAKGHRSVADCWRKQLIPILQTHQPSTTESKE